MKLIKTTISHGPGITAKIYTLKSDNGEKLLSNAYKKYSRKTDTDNRLIKKFNRNTDTLLFINEGTWFKGDDSDIDKIQWVTGSYPLKINGFPSIILIESLIAQVPKKFEEVKGEMMTGYQEYLRMNGLCN